MNRQAKQLPRKSSLFNGISFLLLGAALSAQAIGADFDGNGRGDILWRNAVTGQNAIWLLNNNAAITSAVYIDTVPDKNWRIAGVADFNGDNRDDILWRHSVNGQNAIWFMNGTTVTSGEFIPAVSQFALDIAGVGDFNGDGKADILWRDSLTGQNAIWLMNGATRTSTSNISVADTNWQVAGVSDFNGDGRDDILWRHSVSGQNAIWLITMNGTTVIIVSIDTVPDLGWDIVGVGDFNGDGKADILWRHSVTGQNAVWLMNGVTLTSALFNPSSDTNWQVAGVADFNVDGRDDILMRNKLTGSNAISFMVSGIVVAGQFTTSVSDLNWFVATPDTTPKAFSFAPLTGVALSSTQTSNTVTVSGITGPAPISLNGGGSYSINGGNYTSAQGLIYNSNTVSVRVTSSNNSDTETCATLIVGGVSEEFCATTLAGSDTTPNPFGFTPQTGVPIGTPVTSDPIVPVGYNAAAPISVRGGSYSIDNGPFVFSPGSISPGQSVAVRFTSGGPHTTVCANLTIGGVSGAFCVTTPSDTEPNPFSFTPQTGVSLSTVITSNPIIPTGYNAGATISVSGGSYSINGGTFVTSTGLLIPGQNVVMRLTSSNNPSTQVCATLTIGGVSGQFCATTVGQEGTKTFYPTSDNTVGFSSTDPKVANGVYGSGNLLVGCNWAYTENEDYPRQDRLCYESLVKFNVDTLAGKTIDSATLKLTTNLTGIGLVPRVWHIRTLAPAAGWSGNTVTWNIARYFPYYSNPQFYYNPPTYPGQFYEIDLKTVVQAWANGVSNNGLMFGLNDDETSPYATSFEVFAFFSREEGLANLRPTLTVTYH